MLFCALVVSPFQTLKAPSSCFCHRLIGSFPFFFFFFLNVRLSFTCVPQRAASCRAPSSPSSPAASCIPWRRWRTGRWCSAVKPREALHPSTGECAARWPPPVYAACSPPSGRHFYLCNLSLPDVSTWSQRSPFACGKVGVQRQAIGLKSGIVIT